MEQNNLNREPNPFLGIQFANCGIYTRIYRNKEKTMYVGRCPKCMMPVRVKIGEGGTDSRFFKYYVPCPYK